MSMLVDPPNIYDRDAFKFNDVQIVYKFHYSVLTHRERQSTDKLYYYSSLWPNTYRIGVHCIPLEALATSATD